MKISAKVRAEAIECLMTCAANRQRGGGMNTWQARPWNSEPENLADNALAEVEYHAVIGHAADMFASAAMLLKSGWSP